MKFANLKQDRGQAGTGVLMSLIVALFVIGLLVMIFVLMSGALAGQSYTPTTVTVLNEEGEIDTAGHTLAGASAFGVSGITILKILNGTTVVNAANYTLLNGVLRNATAIVWTDALINYTYVYEANNTATDVITATTTSISSVTDFFSLFIVIGSMVVLILLTVIIIVAIRQSGMLGGATA